ncbi:hypothetical protein [Brevundimonas sp. LM2]|uniref:hypothetical protein n=1 Tax=Brevundimonas sp. LM2 TaxID=1938605 RepID=UPI0012373417|nr:hypothetical protein [Brevundimonas sp. LM2]
MITRTIAAAPLLLTLALLMPAPAAAGPQDRPSATDLRLGLVGQWSGALGYRDYQTDALVEIPVTTTITTPGDGATLVRQSLFDDGPSRPVWITTVSLDDPAAGTSTSASFRAGRAPELDTEAVRVGSVTDPTHWTLIYTRTGEDDDAPADIRVTETRDGYTLLEVKAVRPVGADDAAWRFRNQTRLTRTGD